jgi:phosphate-selective porin OprO/OprP
MPRTGAGAAWTPAGLVLVTLAWAGAARAEDSPAVARRPDPSPTAAPRPKPEAAEAAVEERLRRLEETNEQLLNLVRDLQRQNAELARRLDQQPAVPTPTPPLDRSLEGGEDSIENPVQTDDGAGGRAAGTGTDTGAASAISGGMADALDRSLEGGQDSIENPVQGAPGTWRTGRVRIGPGFMLESRDEEFQLQFHSQLQAEARIYQQGGMNPAASNIDIPRARTILNGRFTKSIEYDLSIEAAYGTINLLNAFLNFKPSGQDRFMVKFGRYKVPFLYEYFAIANVDLLTPERSLFGINYGFNRMPGGQLWGQIWDKRLDYAVGLFNGPRNQFVDFNNDKDVIAYLNLHPFDTEDGPPLLKHLNFGGSVDAGSQNNPVVPRGLKVSVSQSANPLLDNVAPNWLVFNDNVRERGWRSFWSLHAAYFYKQLSVYGEWSSGFQDYGKVGQVTNTRVPIDSWYLAAGYFLTGEEVTRRTQVRPKRNFSLKPGKLGLGAVELVGRYSALGLGDQVFNAGLADPNLWANRAYATDIGFNWYWNPYLKVYVDWEHAVFNQPALFAPGQRQLTSDLFWLRFQLYF